MTCSFFKISPPFFFYFLFFIFGGRRGEYALAEYTEVKTVTIKLEDTRP